MANLQTFEIPARNIARLIARLETIGRKLGEPINLTVGEKIVREIGKDSDGEQTVTILYPITIDCVIPKINGWQFIAAIDHSPESGNIIRALPNNDCAIPEKYRTIDAVCEHCGLSRNRKNTFLLCNDAGEIRQIGRQCLRDFLGHDVAEIAARAELLATIDVLGDGEYNPIGGGGKYVPVQEYLAHCAAVIRAYGWTSRQVARDTGRPATADSALENMFNHGEIKIARKDIELAQSAINFAQNLKARTDYEHNLMVIARENLIEYKSTGILASLIPSYLRAIEQEKTRREQGATSKYFGQVGDKIGDKKNCQIKSFDVEIIGWNSFESAYGTTHLYRFRTSNGEILSWFASGKIDLGGIDVVNGTAVKIIGGTIKKQEEYKGIKTTILTRVKVTIN